MPVTESTERWTEVVLEDGSVLRMKSVVIGVLRAIDAYAADGSPMYSVNVKQILTVKAPDHLKKNAPGATEVH